MITEFELKRSITDVLQSDAKAFQKVRKLLGFAYVLKRQARTLLHARALTDQDRDCNTAGHLDRLARHLRELYEEVRLEADRVSRESKSRADSDLILA